MKEGNKKTIVSFDENKMNEILGFVFQDPLHSKTVE